MTKPLGLQLVCLVLAMLRSGAGVALGQSLSATEVRYQTNQFACRVWDVEDGLPQNSITAILQTSDGYLWLGTPGGLVRFDGTRFVVYGVSDGLPGLHIRTLFQDRQGALWIGTASGLSRYAQGGFTNFTRNKGLAGDTINSITEDSNGTIWVGTVTGLSCGGAAGFGTIGEDRGLTSPYMRASLLDQRGALWITAFKLGLMRWDGRRFVAALAPAQTQDVRPGSLARDSQGRIWAGGEGQVLCLEQNLIKVLGSTNGLPSARITCITVGRDGTVWMGTADQGLYCLPNGGSAAVHQVRELPGKSVQAILEDQEGNLWVGTRSTGLVRLKPGKIVTLQITDSKAQIEPLSLAESPKDVFWVGTLGRGLYRLGSDRIEQASPDRPPVYVAAIATTRDGSIWWGEGAMLRQWKEGRIVVSYGEESWLADDVVQALCADRQEGIWVGSHRGRLMLLRKGQFTVAETGLAPSAVTTLTQQRDGTLWIGSYGAGLARLKDGKRTLYGRAEGLASPIIRSLFLDSEETLWIGTEGGGLSRLRANCISSFTAAQGVADDTIVQVLEDDSGYLWLGTYRGIYRVSRRQLDDLAAGRIHQVESRLFDQSDGLPSPRCKGGFGTCLKARNGSLWFCTDRDVVIINPAHRAERNPPPRVVLEEVQIGNRAQPVALSWPLPTHTEPIRISPGSRLIEFRYTALNFASPERIRFHYRLEGLDSDWVEVGARRVASYAYLPPGKYHFRVAARIGNGVWSAAETGVPLVVVPYVWQTWWFRLALAAAFIAAVIALVRYLSFRRLQRQLHLAEQQAALQRERARIAKDIHDDLGANLSQIALLTGMRQPGQGRQENVTELLSAISATAVRSINALDEIVWAVNPRNDTLSHLIEYTAQFALDYLRLAGIRCRFELPDTYPARELSSDIRHNLFLAAKEALTNVLKHSGASEVRFRVNLGAAALELIIEDNGCGFDPDVAPADGNGLHNLRQRLVAIQGECRIESRPGAGTRVVLRLPWAPA